MATWAAGQRATAGKLLSDSDDTTLSSTTIAVADTWEDYGDETVQFSGITVPVKVKGFASMAALNGGVTADFARARIAISLDGGTTFTTGTEIRTRVGTSHTTTAELTPLGKESGTPTGTIVVKVQIQSGSTSTTYEVGHLIAEIEAQ